MSVRKGRLANKVETTHALLRSSGLCSQCRAPLRDKAKAFVPAGATMAQAACHRCLVRLGLEKDPAPKNQLDLLKETGNGTKKK